MRKIIIKIIPLITMLLLVGCNSTDDINKSDEVINITEDMYVTWVNEIYVNADDYIGKTIKLEGMYSNYYVAEEDTAYNLVYRVGPGCCGTDGDMCGFEFEYSGTELPKENDWIEVQGTIGYYQSFGRKILTIKDAQFVIKDDRGEESVFK